jgi:uncharacterized membrane-anchored protein
MNTNLRSFFSKEANTVICNVFIALVYYAQFTTTINFIYRYIGVVWERPLSGREYCGMLATLMAILVAFFTLDYFLTVPTNATEFVLSDEYIRIFGGPNATNRYELRTCIRGNMVPVYHINKIIMESILRKRWVTFGIIAFSAL